jgi:outer membrane protein insertion porin family
MRKNFWRFLCCLGIFGAALAFGVTSQTPESLPVRTLTVEVVGEAEGSSSMALSMLKTKERERFSQTEFDKDLKQLAKEFDRVDPSVQVVDGEVVVSVKVWKKPIIHEILWKGNQAIETKKLQGELGITKDSVYDRQGFNKAIQKLRQYYVRKGFFESEIDYHITPIQEGVSVDIEIDIQEGKAGMIEEIRFHNLSPEEIDDVSDRLMTKEYCVWLSWLNNQGTFYKDVFRMDESSILGYLQNQGYLDAKVSTEILPSPTRKDRIIIDIKIEKGDLYHLGKVTTSGNLVFSEEDLLKKANLAPGKIYSPESIAVATKAIYSAYGAKGYIDAAVIQEPRLRENEHVYDMNFRIEEGNVFRVGMVQIVGNTQTEPSVILHELLLIPGSIFDTNLLAKSEERLRNIGYFKNVNVYAVKSSKIAADGVAFRDVHVEVEEVSTTARFMAFGGWSSNEGLSGGFGVSETNFKLMGFQQIFSEGFRAIRGGGENIDLKMTVGTRQLTYGASWSKPYFLDTNWVLGVDLQKQRNSYSSSSYTIHSSSAIVSGKYLLNAFTTFGTHYRIQDSHIRLDDIHRTSRNRELIRESKNGGLISAVGTSLYYDSTNHPFFPTQGLRSDVGVEFAGIGGDHRFLVFGYHNAMYFKPFEKGVWKLRANVDGIKTLFGTKPEKLPMDERLYLGGDAAMRGYKYNHVGPKFRDTEHTPRGGMSSVLFSAEYERPLFKRLNGFVFADAGNVWWQEFTAGRLLYTTGFGMRVFITEQTPLTVGFGFPINPKHHRDVRNFFFSIGVSF